MTVLYTEFWPGTLCLKPRYSWEKDPYMPSVHTLRTWESYQALTRAPCSQKREDASSIPPASPPVHTHNSHSWEEFLKTLLPEAGKYSYYQQKLDGLGEWHWNMCIITFKTDRQSRLMHETGCSGLVHWDDPEGWDGEGGSERGTHAHPWRIHVNVWQSQYNIVK